MTAQNWFSVASDGAIQLFIYAQPQAARTQVAGLHNGALKIRVAAPALEDKANQELIRFLAAQFSVTRRQVTLLRGDKSRSKQFAVSGSKLDPAALLPVHPT